MVPSGFRRCGNLSFNNWFSKKYHWLASIASNIKSAKIQLDIPRLKQQKKLFSKHQNKAKSRNLDDSAVISSDFPGLRTFAASMTPTQPQQPQWPQRPRQPHFIKKITDPDG